MPDNEREMQILWLINNNLNRSRWFDGWDEFGYKYPEKRPFHDDVELFQEIADQMIDLDRELSPNIRYFISRVFGQLAEGRTAEDALNQKQSAGRPLDPKRKGRDIRLAISVRIKMNQGISMEEACWQVHLETDTNEHAVERAYKNEKQILKNMFDESGQPKPWVFKSPYSDQFPTDSDIQS